MIRSITKVAAAAAASLTVLVAPAFAHVSLETREAVVGASYKAVLRVPHGCEGAATTSVSVQIPEGFISAAPMPHAGWQVKTVKAPYAKSYEFHGSPVTEGVVEITWSGGELPDEYYDEFVFRGTFAPDVPTDKPFFFPILQKCGDLEEPWIDTSGGEDVEKPAPSLTLLPAEEAGH